MSAHNIFFQSHSQMSIWDPESVTASVKRTKFLDSWKNILILINVFAMFGMGMVMIFLALAGAAQNEDDKIKNSISSLSHVSVLSMSI